MIEPNVDGRYGCASSRRKVMSMRVTVQTALAIIFLVGIAGPVAASDQPSAHRSSSAGAQIPKRFQGVWVFDRQWCADPEGEPGTFVTADGFRREELWGQPEKIYSVSPDGSEIRLQMRYGHEEAESHLEDTRWALSDSDRQLRMMKKGHETADLQEAAPLYRCR